MTKKTQRGAAILELAVLLPLLVVMLFGITEYGRAIYTYDTLAKSVRTAVRHLTVHSAGDPVSQAEARCLVVTGDYTTAGGITTCDGSPVAPGLTTAMVDICDAANASACPGQPHSAVSTGSGVANLVTVRVTAYPFDSVMEFVLADTTFGNAASHTGIAVTMRQDL
ncbi:MAG: TadE-like [Rhodocyclaceae bacterium]|nr:TadE-like [Rhodocyclaceae bacterium]